MFRKAFKFLFSRLLIIILLISFQVIALILLIMKISTAFFTLYTIFGVFSLGVVFYITGQKSNPYHKLAWIIPILIFPVFGGLMYFLLKISRTNKKFKEKIFDSQQRTHHLLSAKEEVLEKLAQEDKNIANQSYYISNASSFPVHTHTFTKYYPSGESFFKELVEELKTAKHFIFIECFIIREGLMWDTILRILGNKAKQGVDVRVMYDDVGCMSSLPYRYREKLMQKGIKCHVFNPLAPFIEIRMNNRDHRKIFIIDGFVSFTGGINIADEYINAYERFGHWKDAAIKVRGDAAWNMTVMFLQLWEFISGRKEDYDNFRPRKYHPNPFESDGFVQPYADIPTDNEPVGENTYLNMIGRAREYIYIFTPYLVLDHEMLTALVLASKSGVDVRIVTPHIPDKKYVFILTQSYYEALIEAGVKIYEYKPGFLHSKVVVSDDVLATVGSINLDYRSLYFHFECGVWLYKSQSIKDIKNDFMETFEKCHEVTLEECVNVSFRKRIVRSFLRLFAPLL